MDRGDGGAHRGDGVGVPGGVGLRVPLGDDDELLDVRAGVDGEGGDDVPEDLVGGLLGGGLDVLRVVVAAGDDDEVLDAAGDVDLAVDDDGEITGAQPVVLRDAGGGAVIEAVGLRQLVAEGLDGLLVAVEVAGGDVVAVDPQLTDGAQR